MITFNLLKSAICNNLIHANFYREYGTANANPRYATVLLADIINCTALNKLKSNILD